MLPLTAEVEEVDVSGNGLLTEKSLRPLVDSLFSKAAQTSLRKLDLQQCLSKCTRSGIQEVMDVVVRLLSEDCGAKFLLKIDLSGIAMGMWAHLPLCQAIRQHAYLNSLSDVGLKGKVADQCVDELMSCATLQSLD